MKPDEGHILTETILADIEDRCKEEYEIAAREMRKKYRDYMAAFEEGRKQQYDLWQAGKISKEEYTNWVYRHTMIGKRWEKMADTLAADMQRTNEMALAIAQGRMPDVFALNGNYATYQIEHDGKIDTGFTLYNHDTAAYLMEDRQLMPGPSSAKAAEIAADKTMQWNKRKIQSAVLQGVLQGESPYQIADRLRGVAEMNYHASVRYARTMTTSAQNAGRYESFHRADKLGVDLTLEWQATLDGRTRHSHRLLHGMRTSVDKPFVVDGVKIMYPAQSAGPGASDIPQALIWNCRCTLLAWVKGFEGETVKSSPKMGDMTYDEWKTEKTPLVSYERKKGTSLTSIGGLREPIRPRKVDFENEDDYYTARDEYRAERERYNASLQEIVDNTIEAGGFSTTEDVISWANDRGILISDEALNSISVNSFSAARPALDEMFSRFPEVKSFSFESSDGSVYKTDFRIGVAKEGLLSANGGFNFNVAYFGNGANEYGIKDGLMGIMDKRLVFGDGSFSTLVRHEYGHNVQEYIEFKLADKYHYHVDDWRKYYKTFDEYDKARNTYFAERHQYEAELIQLAGLQGSSGYSNTNTLELFAEGFAEWSSGGESEFGKAFGEFLRRWY